MEIVNFQANLNLKKICRCDRFDNGCQRSKNTIPNPIASGIGGVFEILGFWGDLITCCLILKSYGKSDIISCQFIHIFFYISFYSLLNITVSRKITVVFLWNLYYHPQKANINYMKNRPSRKNRLTPKTIETLEWLHCLQFWSL